MNEKEMRKKIKEQQKAPLIKLNPAHLLLKNKVEFDDIVSIKIPTVLEVIESNLYSISSHIFNIQTRELFTPFEEVDDLEKRYPTIWEMMFDKENDGDSALGQLLGVPHPASTLVMEGFEYWTGLDKHGFSKLINGKIIHQDSGWIVDKEKFLQFQESIRKVTNYEPNKDLIAPPNMTVNRHRAWIKMYENRIKKLKRRNGNSLADKILILQASFDSYVSIEEIVSMTYFQFEKLYHALQEKEGYLRNWEVHTSPKFESDKKNITHWASKVRI